MENSNKTSIEQLKLTAPELSDKSDDELNQFIGDAYSEVIASDFPTPFIEEATRYLAAFLGRLNKNDQSQIKTKKLSSLQIEYFQIDDLGKGYWQRYKHLLDNFAKNSNRNRLRFY